MRAARQRRIRRLLTEIEQANEARFLAAPFPLYGLPPSITAPRWIASSGYRSDRAGYATNPEAGLQLELSYGDPTDLLPSLLRVATAASAGESPERLAPLRRLLWQEVVADRLAAPSRRWKFGWFKAPDEQGIGGSPQLLPILVDGQPHQFALLQEGLVQVARVELADLAPYLDGRRQLIARLLTAPN